MTDPCRMILPCGRVALVDADDAARVSAYRWRIDSKKKYVRRSVRHGDKVRTVYLHHEVMGDGLFDHINGDGLDNRKRNLRAATPAQNTRNRKVQRTSRSGLKGVGYDKRNPHRPWRANILVDGLRRHLGYFRTPYEAAAAYDDAARTHFGEFARLNFPSPQRRGGA